jgi:3-oxo-5-alpha-steroid 4-dehydrogenase 3 / polyprenol reductase
LKTLLAVLLFFLASGVQHDCHKYLASLKKYSLPENRTFQWVLCPHYTCDCIIYLSLAIVAAPDAQVLNKTISTVLLFTIVNLGITAESSRKWYAEKFGAERIAGRWRMVPFVY